jgi:hypothetical protein
MSSLDHLRAAPVAHSLRWEDETDGRMRCSRPWFPPRTISAWPIPWPTWIALPVALKHLANEGTLPAEPVIVTLRGLG